MMSSRVLRLAGAVVAVLGAAAARGQSPLNRDYTGVTHVPDQGYPFWMAPKAVPAAPGEVDLVLKEGDLVLGVAVGDDARAYPIGFFWGPAHEILNDTLGGTPIAPSW